MKQLFLFILLLFFHSFVLAQYTIPPKPDKPSEQKSVYQFDGLKVLNEYQESALRHKLENYEDSTGTQIVVAIIKSTKGENISYLGARWGEAWGIGQEEQDNGVIILVAIDDRDLDINTGYGVFYHLTNRDIERIVNRVILPRFKQGDYYGGLDAGTDALIAGLTGKFSEDNKDVAWPGWIPIALVLLVIFLVLFFGRGGDSGHGPRRRHWDDDTVIFTNMGRWGGGGSFGGGGGGFSGGFGGGSFGGSGASGSW